MPENETPQPTPLPPTPPEQPTPEISEAAAPRHISHSYQDDLSQAMNATDASVVQQLLQEARDREENARLKEKNDSQRKWYSTVSLTLIIIAIGAIGYGLYHYLQLTVPVVQKVSVGVFPSTESFTASATDIRQVVSTIITDNTLKENTPYLVPLVSDETTRTLLQNTAFFSFLEADATEPFIAVFDSARLGVIKTESGTKTFFIGSVSDPVVATKEFLIAEPELLNLFYRALNIDLTTVPREIGSTFTQTYRYWE